MKIMLLSVFLAIISIPTPAFCEALSLKEALDIALENNPVLKSYRWTVKARQLDLESAKGALYPRFSIEERYMRTDNPTYGFMAKLDQERFTQEDFRISSLNDPDDISDFRTSIGFQQPLYLPRAYAGIRMAGKELKAGEAELTMKSDMVALDVVTAFNNIHTAGEYIKAARKGIEDAMEHRRLASLRYESGTGLHSDLLRAEVKVKRAEGSLIKAESRLEVAKRALGLILGRTGPVDIAPEKTVLPLKDIGIYLEASRDRYDLKAGRLRYESSKQAVKAEKSAFLPEAVIGGNYFMNDHSDPFSPEGESYMITAFLRWDIFDASSHRKIKKAKAKSNEAREHLAGLEKEINFRVHEAYISVVDMKHNLSIARSVLEQAEESARLVRMRYENSLSPMVDLLDTQVMLDTARAGVVEAENEYLNAVADLYFQSGLLLQTIISGYELNSSTLE